MHTPFMRLTPMVCVLTVLACAGDEPVSPAGSGGSSEGGSAGGSAPGGSGGIGGTGPSGGQGGCSPSLPVDDELPEMLSATGLYDDIASKQVAAHARSFAPQFQLWSDGAVKQRWVYLPECSVIDTRDMDDWSLPVGARMWKEFAVDGVRIETRLIERVALGAQDFRFTAYLWNDGETDAQRVPDGQLDAKGTTHDVPDEDACRRCHGSHEKGGGRPSRALGLSALQLSHANAGLTLDGLDAEGLLSVPPAASYIVPGNDIERAALGYLHANCGHCHNATADAVPQVDMDLWLRIDQLTVDTTSAYATTVGQPNTIFNDQNVSARIEPGNPQSSAVWYRMNQRGNNAQMPPLASELSDVTGAGAVSAWIASLP